MARNVAVVMALLFVFGHFDGEEHATGILVLTAIRQ
jgi:hypothetical protein